MKLTNFIFAESLTSYIHELERFLFKLIDKVDSGEIVFSQDDDKMQFLKDANNLLGK